MFKFSTASIHVLLSSTLWALASFAGVRPSAAQSTDVRVNVPFAFQADGRHFDPGVYTIQISDAVHLMRIVGSSQSGQMTYVPDATLEPAKTGRIVFQRYGTEYFLREVWVADSKSHVHTLRSKAEKQLQLAANATLRNANNGVELAVTHIPR